MKKAAFLVSFFAGLLLSLRVDAQLMPLPRNLQFDSLTLVLTWDAPQAVLLEEHFETATFPPPAWKDSTQGMGWFTTTNGSSAYLLIPQHSKYAVINNGLATPGNNGCCDYLITPEMDLTQANGFKLSFSSFFKGADAETASVLISTDGGSIWEPLLEVLPHFAWANLQVDLSPYSGTTGYQHVKIAFLANDHGQADATGWAIDDVLVASDSLSIWSYEVFLDGAMVAQTPNTWRIWTYDPATVSYASAYSFCVCATYLTGFGNVACKNASGYYLAPPVNLQAQIGTSGGSGMAILGWEPPAWGDKKPDGSYTPATRIGSPVDYSDTRSDFIATAKVVSRAPAASVIYDNGTIVNSPGTGAGGADESIIPAGGLSYGYNFNQAAGITVAEDFTLAYKCIINEVSFLGFQPNSGLTSGITGLYFRIYDGNPATNGSLIWGDLTTNRMNHTEFANIYRVNAAGQGTDRPVMSISSYNLNLTLNPGTYWIEWQVTGSGSTGSWVPNTADVGNGNAQKHNSNGWSPLLDPAGVGLPFMLLTNSGSVPGNLLSYNIYRDNVLLANVPPSQLQYYDLNLAPGTYCYYVTAVYDLTALGFPGQTGETAHIGPACVNQSMNSALPFTENWSTQQFDTNLWTVGPDWTLDLTNGNPGPAARYTSQAGSGSYSSSLISYYLGPNMPNSTTPVCTFLDFDYLLSADSLTASEKLSVQILTADTVVTVQELVNNGTSGWAHEHIDITSLVSGLIFRIGFVANGTDSGHINYWMVDNIHAFYKYGFAPPLDLTAENAGNPLQNNIQLNWGLPLFENSLDLIQDDSSWENSLNINQGYTAWLGNKFTSGKGKLRSASIFWIQNINATYNPIVLDVFNAAHELLGSSVAFLSMQGSWQSIALPDLAVDGDFYVMVHFAGQSGVSDFLGMDSTTLSGRPNNGWYYDGTNWSQMNALGFEECVFSIRASLVTPGDCEIGDSKPDRIIKHTNGPVSSLNLSNGEKSTGGSAAPQYEVYRREYQVPVPGQDSMLTDWHRVATVAVNNYLDPNLDLKCYQYYARAMYEEGSSLPSNIGEACFLVGMDEHEASGIKMYPNPASDFLSLEMQSPAESMTVYNATGSIVAEVPVENQKVITLNVSRFPSGIYILKLTTSKGESLCRKFLKL
jgi:hypothetical protein